MNTLYGTIAGNIIGTIYFLLFQLSGIILAQFVFKKKTPATILLCGSVFGSVMLQWLPALFAFVFGFSLTAHILALAACAIFNAVLYLCKLPHISFSVQTMKKAKNNLSEHRLFIFLCAVTFVLFCIMLSTHTLLPKEDGFHTGQCTYGDMNMHLGIITSLARQGNFPPEYSISPGSRLCYPFLCDSISSSIYIWGASLRYAYMLPMYFAILQVFTGFYLLAYSWLQKAAKACLAWFFFFFNGGLAFVYFIDWSKERTYEFTDIFTGYYLTPTNLVDNNIRWVNVIVDMLLPQRSTLFGFAVLFTCIWLLFRAVFRQEKDLFLPAAVLTGALPMIHTHSFLAMALISASWLLMQLFDSVYKNINWKHPGKIILPAFLVLMCAIQLLNNRDSSLDSSVLFAICISGLGILTLLGIWCLIRYIRQNDFRQLMSTWGIYLLLIIVLALPQLIIWTFTQSSSNGFIQGHFNWANLGDNYLWFYIKNWGIILLLLIPALLYGSRKNFAVVFPGFLIWFVMELVSLSPLAYDNNKLLYVTYIFFCCISADFGYDIYHDLKSIPCIRLWSTAFLFLSGVSAVLSMGREVISDYTVYSNQQIDTALFIDKNLPADAVFLTNSRHVNEAAALAGRNIVNGADMWLSTHGIYNAARVQNVRTMYESPDTSMELFKQYNVSYVIISPWERYDYAIDDALFDSLFECIFENDNTRVYRVTF